MANYGSTTPRSSPNPPSPPTGEESEDPYQKSVGHPLTLSFAIKIPSSPEAAAKRIVGNLVRFAWYYVLFVWTVLFISLAPARHLSVVYLVATTEVGFLYFLLLRALPDRVLDRVVDRRFVFFLLFVIACLLVILTNASKHLFVVLAATVPVVMAHAALIMSTREPAPKDGEMARLVQEKLDEAARTESMV